MRVFWGFGRVSERVGLGPLQLFLRGLQVFTGVRVRRVCGGFVGLGFRAQEAKTTMRGLRPDSKSIQCTEALNFGRRSPPSTLFPFGPGGVDHHKPTPWP